MFGNVLGLSQAQALAYRELVGTPSLDAGDLARRMGTEPGEAYAVLQVLEEHGLAARQGTDDSRFQAAPPEIALGAILARRTDELRTAQLEMLDLEEEYRRAADLRPASDIVDLVRGSDAVLQRILQLQAGARETVETFQRPPVLVMGPDENTAEEDAVRRGVRYRAVTDRSMIDEGITTIDVMTEDIRAGEEIRIADNVPIKAFIIDRRLAIVPVQSQLRPDDEVDTVSALIIHESGLLDGIIALFEAFWRDAVPLRVQPDGMTGELDDVDLKILGLMLSGLTDQAVAKHLELGLRTVQRRVKSMMDTAGVATRIQLGWHAARKGWL
ncbi:helix-turn-helix domain-containing protein [Myceligenerans crystallogenes]|uniref:LuxR family transcriptional regulator n=1 Tax=Myceligenerans crystallogenes TaxID=316335 RepID=A0ABP4ZR89_9MICO